MAEKISNEDIEAVKRLMDVGDSEVVRAWRSESGLDSIERVNQAALLLESFGEKDIERVFQNNNLSNSINNNLAGFIEEFYRPDFTKKLVGFFNSEFIVKYGKYIFKENIDSSAIDLAVTSYSEVLNYYEKYNEVFFDTISSKVSYGLDHSHRHSDWKNIESISFKYNTALLKDHEDYILLYNIFANIIKHLAKSRSFGPFHFDTIERVNSNFEKSMSRFNKKLETTTIDRLWKTLSALYLRASIPGKYSPDSMTVSQYRDEIMGSIEQMSYDEYLDSERKESLDDLLGEESSKKILEQLLESTTTDGAFKQANEIVESLTLIDNYFAKYWAQNAYDKIAKIGKNIENNAKLLLQENKGFLKVFDKNSKGIYSTAISNEGIVRDVHSYTSLGLHKDPDLDDITEKVYEHSDFIGTQEGEYGTEYTTEIPVGSDIEEFSSDFGGFINPRGGYDDDDEGFYDEYDDSEDFLTAIEDPSGLDAEVARDILKIKSFLIKRLVKFANKLDLEKKYKIANYVDNIIRKHN